MSPPLVAALSTIFLFASLAVTFWIHNQYHLEIVVPPEPPSPLPTAGDVDSPDKRLQPGGETTLQPPLISAIVPARNEARNIRRCVEGLLAQTYLRYEVIVVDDRSSDDTPRILDELTESSPARLRVIHGQEPPAGWAGKPHALYQGAAAAGGDWLCFVDADTFVSPEALSATYATAVENQAGLFTMMTDQELGSFWERVILPVVFTALSFGFPARHVNDPSRPEAIANGQFILIRREVYEAVGGHRAVRDRIDEDKALAERVKRSGFRLLVADGRAVARTRMYTSLAEIWEGWTKNIFLGMRDRLGLLLFGAVIGLLGALALPLWLIAGLAWFLADGGPLPALVTAEAAALWVYLLYQRGRAARAFHISAWYALTLPLGALIFTTMMFVSAFRVLSGQGVTWKGRTYST